MTFAPLNNARLRALASRSCLTSPDRSVLASQGSSAQHLCRQAINLLAGNKDVRGGVHGSGKTLALF